MTEFREIMQLRVRHDFYRSGESNDFRLEPLGATAALFAARHMIFRQDGSTVRIFVETIGTKPMVDLSDITSFQFGMALLNSRFSLFTDLAETDPAYRTVFDAGQIDNQLWFNRLPCHVLHKEVSGSTLVEKAALDYFDFVPINLRTSNLHQAATVRLIAASGETALEKTLSAKPGVTDATNGKGWINDTLDVRDLQRGLYSLKTDLPGHTAGPIFLRETLNTSYFRTIWLDLAAGDLVTSAGDLKPATSYDISFTAVEKTWTYHVVVGQKRLTKTLKIKHTPPSGEPEILFQPPVSGPVTNNQKELTFTTVGTVGFKEQPRSTISLLQEPDPPSGPPPATPPDDETVIENLPSPTPGEAKPEVFVNV